MTFLSKLFHGNKTKKSVLPDNSVRQQAPGGVLVGLAKVMVDEMSATADTTGLVPGDVVVSLTDPKTVALGAGGLLQDAEDKNIAYLDVLVLMSPRTGKTGLFAKGPDGIQTGLEGLMNDRHKLYVLRIARDNLEYLKSNRQVWGRVKKVIGA